MRGHLPALDHGRMDPAPAPYMIRINGHLGATVLSAFPAMAMAPRRHGAHTMLTGRGQLAVGRRCAKSHGPPPGGCGQIGLARQFSSRPAGG